MTRYKPDTRWHVICALALAVALGHLAFTITSLTGAA